MRGSINSLKIFLPIATDDMARNRGRGPETGFEFGNSSPKCLTAALFGCLQDCIPSRAYNFLTACFYGFFVLLTQITHQIMIPGLVVIARRRSPLALEQAVLNHLEILGEGLAGFSKSLLMLWKQATRGPYSQRSLG